MNHSPHAPTVSVPARGRADAPPMGNTYVMQGVQNHRALDTYHLILAPTHACNLRCGHCYLPDHSSSLLSEDVALSLVDQWAKITLTERGAFRGIFHVKGGEPFVVPYLSKIFDRLVELQALRLMLTTNGTFTKSKELAALKRCHDDLGGYVTVIVSLDGATAATHNRLRGTGQFQVTVTFLESLRRMGIHTFLNCVLYTENLQEVRPYIELAKSLGVAQINFLPLVPKGYGSQLRCHQAPHVRIHQEVHEAYESGDDATRELLAGSLSHILHRQQLEAVPAAHECVAAYRGLFYITPDGSAHTCPNLIGTKHRLGNVRTETLRAIMQRLPDLHRSLRLPGGQSDRFVCTGERHYYEEVDDRSGLVALKQLQNSLGGMVGSATESSPTTAYCVSRNF